MHVEAIEVCRDLIGQAAQRGHELEILDIGGGFPVDYLRAARCPSRNFARPFAAP